MIYIYTERENQFLCNLGEDVHKAPPVQDACPLNILIKQAWRCQPWATSEMSKVILLLQRHLVYDGSWNSSTFVLPIEKPLQRMNEQFKPPRKPGWTREARPGSPRFTIFFFQCNHFWQLPPFITGGATQIYHFSLSLDFRVCLHCLWARLLYRKILG